MDCGRFILSREDVGALYFMGVDSGGTKTAFVLADENGYILARHRSGSGGFFEKGETGLFDLISEGTAAICQKAKIEKSEITYAGLGFPGYGEKEGSEAAITTACERAVAPGRVKCECDCYVSWAGSLAMEPGVNITSGTGSICYGVNALGDTARSGGWGAYCDEGSCRWLGGRLIQLYAKQADGRMPRTVLYELFRARLGIRNDVDFIHPINHEYATDAAKTAALQVLLNDIYDAGDLHAAMLYREAAVELWLSARTVAEKLDMRPGFLVSYSGGLFQSGDCILTPLREAAEREGGCLMVPRFAPELGAVLTAMRVVMPKMDFTAFSFKEGETQW